MRFISTRMHGIMDYLYGIIIIASPWLFSFNRGDAETTIPVVAGIAVILMSLMTDYELSIIKVFSINFHLMMDLVVGLFLIASPWLFGFSYYVTTPHIVFGVIAIAASLMTVHSPSVHRTTISSRI